ncbi:hypothetical protein [Zobellella sp. DQSA1]|uniref:hypothetical protein n=1 Tax=Zobellella sp. DQSA1 TaxID=3342386 RepID=UPI0035C183EA
MNPSIAIIGAGLVRELLPRAGITLFEKARGLGGRVEAAFSSTRALAKALASRL